MLKKALPMIPSDASLVGRLKNSVWEYLTRVANGRCLMRHVQIAAKKLRSPSSRGTGGRFIAATVLPKIKTSFYPVV